MQAGLGPVFSTQLQARKVIWQGGGGGGCRAVPRDSWCQGRGSLQQASKRDPYLHLPAAAGRSVLLNCNSWCLSKIFTQSLGIIDPKIPSQHRTHQPPATDFSVLSDLQSCQSGLLSAVTVWSWREEQSSHSVHISSLTRHQLRLLRGRKFFCMFL